MENKYNNVINAYTSIKRGDKDIIILDTDKIKDIATQNAIQDIQRKLDTDFDLSYEVMSDACYFISDLSIEEIQKNDDNLSDKIQSLEVASVYTNTRLSWLNCNNESEIMDIIKEYNNYFEKGRTSNWISVSTACAVWYDNQVKNAVNKLLNYIRN